MEIKDLDREAEGRRENGNLYCTILPVFHKTFETKFL
jgi:hypothetical protein